MRLEMMGGKGIYRRKLNTNVTEEVGDTENKLRWYCKLNIIHGALFLLGYYSCSLQDSFTHISWTLDSKFLQSDVLLLYDHCVMLSFKLFVH